MKKILLLILLLNLFTQAFASNRAIGLSGYISSGGGLSSGQNYEEVLEVLEQFSIPQDAHWTAVLSVRGEIDVIFIHLNGEVESLVNNRGQWQHNINVDANAWRLHIHHAELKAMIMSEGLGLNRYLIMGGVGTKQMVFGQVTMSGSIGVMFLVYNVEVDQLGQFETYSFENAESLYAGLNLRYKSERIDVRGKFAIFGTPQLNRNYSFTDYLLNRELGDLYLGTEVGYFGQFSLFVNVRNRERKVAIGPYIDIRYMQTSFQTEFFAGVGIRIQRRN